MYSPELIRRALQYRMSLRQLRILGVRQVYSYTLANETGYSAALVRKDFSILGIRGRRRGGYEIEDVLGALKARFQETYVDNVIIVGMGNIGQALSNYKGFINNNISVVAGFDIDPVKIKKKYDIPVYPMDRCREIIDAYKVEAGIIAVSPLAAQSICDEMIHCGITGIMNFAPVNLKVPKGILLRNISLTDELRHLLYQVRSRALDRAE